MTVALLALVLAVVGIAVALARRDEPAIHGQGDRGTYEYAKSIQWLVAVPTVCFPILTTVAFLSGRLNGMKEVAELLAFAVFGLLLLIAFSRTRFVLTETSITEIAPWQKTELPLSEIRKIVIYHSSGNPAAAMTRVRGRRTITLTAMLAGYEGLVGELRSLCKHAEVIEKQKAR